MSMMSRWTQRGSNGGSMERRGREGEERTQMEPFFRPLMTLQEEMNRIFEDFYGSVGTSGGGGLSTNFQPMMDVTENEKEISLRLDVPGMEREDIEIALSDQNITISGERSEKKEEKKEDYLHRERRYGMFRRTLPLPEHINRDKVSATFKNGVLQVVLPKTDEGRKNWRRIDVK